MMAKYLAFVVVFGALVCAINVSRVQCADQCKTHADCKNGDWKRYCCGGILGIKDRTCSISSCLLHYCSSDSDCGDLSMCCRSNRCVDKGCSGCTTNTDCYRNHVCCKKTFTLDQTVCAANCNNQTCNSNDDCGGRRRIFGSRSKCCRSGKCKNSYRACRDKCTSNSECDLDQYCCKKKRSWGRGDSCAKSCVGEICSTSDDCGGPNECCISNKCVERDCPGCTTNSNCSTGHYCCKKRQRSGELSECNTNCIGKSCSSSYDCGGPNECCISNKCVERDCPGCTTNSDCSTGHYCCKKRQWYGELSECSANCIEKSCSSSDDCGGPGEICDSDQRCAVNRKSNTASNSNTASSSFPSWLIAVITVSLAIFLIAVGIILTVFWCIRSKRPANATRAVAVPLHNTQYQGAEIQNQQPNTQYQDSSGQQMYPPSAPYQDYDHFQVLHNPPYNPHYQGNP